MAEITRRQQASTFSEKNLRSVIYNVAALFGCYVLEKVVVSKYVVLYTSIPTPRVPQLISTVQVYDFE